MASIDQKSSHGLPGFSISGSDQVNAGITQSWVPIRDSMEKDMHPLSWCLYYSSPCSCRTEVFVFFLSVNPRSFSASRSHPSHYLEVPHLNESSVLPLRAFIRLRLAHPGISAFWLTWSQLFDTLIIPTIISLPFPYSIGQKQVSVTSYTHRRISQGMNTKAGIMGMP